MKLSATLFLLFCLSAVLPAQSVEPAPTDKAVVYFVRASGLGAVVNFHYYNGDQLIGKFNGTKYMRYECEPGEHVFWARSENRSFVEADLMAGNIYLIKVTPLPGGLKAGVALSPIDPQIDEIPKAIRRLVTKRASQSFSPDLLRLWAERTHSKTLNGMKKYLEKKEDGKAFEQLTADMMVAPEDMHWEKKRKH